MILSGLTVQLPLPLKFEIMAIIGKNMLNTKNAWDKTTTPRTIEASGKTE